MRYIHNIEFILLNLVDDEVKREIKNLKRRYPEAFLEGVIGKKGGREILLPWQPLIKVVIGLVR